MQSVMKFYNNIYNVNNKGKRIMDMNKLTEGKLYVLDMHGDIKFGPLIKKDLSNFVDRTNYYGLYFRIGLAKYDGITLTDHVHQYHLQSHLNLPAMQLHIYEYNLFSQLQEQIKYWQYYKKTINNLCKELNIPEDIERIIKLYF
jgi:hypothetical protein